MQIRNRIPLRLEDRGCERGASRRLRPECQGMIDVIFLEAGFHNLFRGEVPGELVDDGTDHFHVRQLLGSDIRQQPGYLTVRHGVALGEVALGGGQLSVGAAEL